MNYAKFHLSQVCQVPSFTSMPSSIFHKNAKFHLSQVCQVPSFTSMPSSIFHKYVKFHLSQVCKVPFFTSMSSSIFYKYAKFHLSQVCQVPSFTSMPSFIKPIKWTGKVVMVTFQFYNSIYNTCKWLNVDLRSITSNDCNMGKLNTVN